MTVLRITPNLLADDPQAVAGFYRYLFDIDVAMDMGFIVTMEPGAAWQSPQLSLASEGGAGTPLPAISIEVDTLDPVIARAKLRDIPIEYGPVTEDWGVRRLFLRDPAGHLLNVLTHEAAA
ncbi:glyoxalase [Primorskyibacter flagellatus]|uniref:Glyoxalase n=1 Tax=Primorskyibacter flagellatus TaxID=1387277 RepID=A0A917A8M9_9RHOB|nr:VOC family protein [Primorskyibacter flagellatus]GGE35570.1 glyoxalase [Primorskyibacter flagellatus]